MNKKLAIFAVIAIAACGVNAATKTEPNVVNFSTNVFLHDAPSTPLHTRIPTGQVVSIEGDLILPVQADYDLQGNLTIETNKTLTMSYKPDVAAVTNSVILSSAGYLTLRRWVDGTGWVENTLDPTDWPASATATNEVVEMFVSAGEMTLEAGGDIPTVADFDAVMNYLRFAYDNCRAGFYFRAPANMTSTSIEIAPCVFAVNASVTNTWVLHSAIAESGSPLLADYSSASWSHTTGAANVYSELDYNSVSVSASEFAGFKLEYTGTHTGALVGVKIRYEIDPSQ